MPKTKVAPAAVRTVPARAIVYVNGLGPVCELETCSLNDAVQLGHELADNGADPSVYDAPRFVRLDVLERNGITVAPIA